MSVSLLLPMKGADNGTVFTDYSPTQKTITRYGNAKTTTSQSKYYGSSGYFDGSGDYLSVPHSSEFLFETGDFTVEVWVYLTAFPGEYSVAEPYRNDMTILGPPPGAANGSTALFLLNYNNGAPRIWDGNTGFGFSSPLPLGQWNHVAWARASGTLRIFMNGISSSEFAYTANLNAVTSQWNLFGYAYNQDRFFPGWAQDMRVIKGTALYTDNFTPPDRLLKSVSGTILGADGNPAARTVRIHDRSTGALITEGTSDATTGDYDLGLGTTDEVQRIVLADEVDLYNDIVDRVIPG